MSERRQWMIDAERSIDEERVPPPAVKFRADPGWRLVWMLVREREEGIRALHCELAIGIAPITFWGLEAPTVVPGIPGMLPESTLGEPATLLPLHGAIGHRLATGARVFSIASPIDTRTDAELIAECDAYLSETERLAQR